MLKIKDDIPLRILKNYGFTLNNKEWFSININGANLLVKPISREITISSYNTSEYHDLEILYSLINDGLVEMLKDDEEKDL